MEIGKTMREIRIENGMSQSELRRQIGVAQPSLSRIENGKTTPKWQTIVKFCGAIDISLAELILRSIRDDDLPPSDDDKKDTMDIVNLAVRRIMRSRR